MVNYLVVGNYLREEIIVKEIIAELKIAN